MTSDNHSLRLAKLLGAYSHLDAQSCLAITVLVELAGVGYEGQELEIAFEARMRAHVDRIRERQLLAMSG